MSDRLPLEEYSLREPKRRRKEEPAAPSPLQDTTNTGDARQRGSAKDPAAPEGQSAIPSAFQRLPPEVVVQIFAWLPRCVLPQVALVCKQFHQLCQHELLWRRVNLAGRQVPSREFFRVLQNGAVAVRAARTVFTKPAIGVQPDGLRFAVQYLDLGMTNLESSELEKVLGPCTQLRKVSLESVDVSDRVLRLLARNPRLEVLNLCLARKVTGAGLVAVARGCRQLRELNLSWTHLTEEELEALVPELNPDLVKLNLSGNRSTLLDSHVVALCDACPDLEDLDLSDASQLTELTPEACASSLPRIRQFSASRCYNIVPASYLHFDSNPSLEFLNVFGLLKPPALQELEERLPGVKVNKMLFSEIARPTVGIKRTSIWGIRVRE